MDPAEDEGEEGEEGGTAMGIVKGGKLVLRVSGSVIALEKT